MSPKPVYRELHRLIKGTWWTGPLKLVTDDAGRVRFRGFLGQYALAGKAGRGTFALEHCGQRRLDAKLKRR